MFPPSSSSGSLPIGTGSVDLSNPSPTAASLARESRPHDEIASAIRNAEGANGEIRQVRPSALTRWFSDEVYVHDSKLKAYLRRSFPSVQDVDDVMQELYVRAWRSHRKTPIASVKAFLFTIARHLMIDRLRREIAAPFQEVGDLETLEVCDERSSVMEAAHEADMAALLVDAVDSLPARCREVVILRKFKLLTTRETAERLGVIEHTVEMQLMRGLRRVRKYLEKRGVKSVLGRES